jgi:methionine-gamma-lyase
MRKQFNFDTLCLHGEAKNSNPFNALNPPIFMTSTFTFDDVSEAEAIMNFDQEGYIYTRGNNPTLKLFEQRMAVLEQGAEAVAFASGMAAISSVLLSLLSADDTVIVHKTLYGSSFTVVHNLLPKYNIRCKSVDFTKPETVEAALDGKTAAFFFETPANPNLAIIDLERIVGLAQTHDVPVVVDNTFATPYFQRPLMHGADVVVHSATKYICGHGDALGGIAIANDKEYIQRLKFDYMCELGGVMSPFNAWLMLRGLKTLALRMRQHENNAGQLAEFLQSHPKVAQVMYPGLPTFSSYGLARKQMDGFGAMISFELKGGLAAATTMVRRLQLIQLAVSLGDCETLIELPAAMTHARYPKQALLNFGLSESMLRLSVGLEHITDLIHDLDQALDF